jgi:hypothetical protein
MDPKPRPLVVDAHVIAYLGDYMINLKKSLNNSISKNNSTYSLYIQQSQSSQVNTSSSRHKT